MQTKNLFSSQSGVIELEKKDFATAQSQKSLKLKHKAFKDKYGIIIFYAPWCPHCQESVPMLSDIAQEFKYKFPIGAVNCENPKNHLLCSITRIELLPTIKLVDKDGSLKDYNGPRDKDDIMYYICRKI